MMKIENNKEAYDEVFKYFLGTANLQFQRQYLAEGGVSRGQQSLSENGNAEPSEQARSAQARGMRVVGGAASFRPSLVYL
ncbi:hypothetical protein N7509_013647 [Penicillium cosmopolitanum]|uniref:Uncharacterized protein n=1 Tax=Penicillium cosmopolitanum TaxID=1131564 RepID=A0A9W9SDR9_9EURO|nr:uncharacterized protein N7509_013647 [Penicillium cosmopolitanum]KAJ5376761.1 hypothetical protein N7509_013647 [Penicillium cosmopolitanum]